MARHLLAVVTASVSGEGLRDRVSEHAAGEPAHVRIVAPASDLSRLDWLASAEDEAREEADERARVLGEAVAPAAESVEAVLGDADPVQAIRDALVEFPADEILLVTHPDDEASWLEEGAAEEAWAVFDLPVTRLVAAQS
ncbi:MAG TPA: hypothetical protein VD704_14190 [Gaiellaceae bacterium]|nr:hypothetical protein [Gaiellaceae bacterium]